MEVTDFGRSFITWTRKPRDGDFRIGWGNSVRINLEARVTIDRESDGSSEDFYLGAACRSEWMYRDSEHFKLPGSDFLMAYARDRCLKFSANITSPQDRPEIDPFIELLTALNFEITRTDGARLLESEVDVAEAARSASPVIATTKIRNEKLGRSAVLEYPVKTLNYHPDHQRFQVDTGPVLWPDLASPEPAPIRWINLAFVAYNRLDEAEFAKRVPTAVADSAGGTIRIDDYQEIESGVAVNSVYAVHN